MKNLKFIRLVSTAIFLSVFCGCAGKGEVSGTTELADRRRCAGEIIRAIAERDYGSYRKFAGESSGIHDRKNFIFSCDDMEKRLGKITGFAFLVQLETPEVDNLVYRVDLCRKNPRGGELKHQQLFQLIFGSVDGRVQLLGMRIM